ncbi:MAG TPA: CHAT domain-containing protein [Thioploca sp.]|nr:CHAT domain-containing protein [Thioploca sp.]
MNFNKNIIVAIFAIYSAIIQAQDTNESFFYTGHYETAIAEWEALPVKDIQIWIKIAKAYRYLGLPDKSLTILTTNLETVQQNSVDHAILLNELSQLHLSQARIKLAKQTIQTAVKIIRPLNNKLLLANMLRQLGNVQSAEDEYAIATKYYAKALDLVIKYKSMTSFFSKDEIRELYGKILVNQAQTTFWLDADNSYQYSVPKRAFKSSLEKVKYAIQATKNWPDAFSEVFALIKLSKIMQNIQAKFSEPELTTLIYQVLNQAREVAERIDNYQAKTNAYGYLGQLYEQNHRYSDALILTRKALFAAQQLKEQLSMYRWQWQLGRIFKAQNNFPKAILVLKQAVKIINLPAIREQVMEFDSNNFRAKISPVYFTLADLLLQQGDDNSIREARDTIEFFKQAELQDYFQSECFNTQCIHLEQALDFQTAILYPIVLPDRLELLLSLPNVTELIRIKVPVTKKKLRREIAFLVSALRRHPLSYLATADEEEVICTPESWRQLSVNISPRAKDFLSPAQKLYRWLIKPLLASLTKHNINTLIIVPEGVLRTVPFSALHDGKEFLIQNYALASTPSLCLTDLQIQQRNVNEMLVTGLSESVQGFSDLPCAKYEVDTLQKRYNLFDSKYKPLFNNDFTYSNMQQRINQTKYSILHIASHGQFKPDLADTFLLTYDDKLSMNKLENLIKRTNKIDLLTLSACETAVGNDRAALGLAGVALKAGVKSALASLWKVDDAATPAMLIEFYQQLTNSKLTKAQALKNAQIMMLTNAKYAQFQHPYYWSAFLLIGNWY